MSLIFVGVLGVVHLARFGAGPSFTKESFFAGSATNPSKYAIALYSGLWAFDGWDACSVGHRMLHKDGTAKLTISRDLVYRWRDERHRARFTASITLVDDSGPHVILSSQYVVFCGLGAERGGFDKHCCPRLWSSRDWEVRRHPI